MKEIISWIKIPFRAIVTIILIGSSILLFADEAVTRKLYLLDFKNSYGTWIGVAFIGSIGLFVYYIWIYLSSIYKKHIKRPRVQRKLLYNLNDTELGIVLHVFCSPGHCAELDFNNPVVDGLVSKNILFFGGSQVVTLNYLTGKMPGKYTLQPFVISILNDEIKKSKAKLDKLDRKLVKCKNKEKKKQLESEKNKIRENLESLGM